MALTDARGATINNVRTLGARGHYFSGGKEDLKKTRTLETGGRSLKKKVPLVEFLEAPRIMRRREGTFAFMSPEVLRGKIPYRRPSLAFLPSVSKRRRNPGLKNLASRRGKRSWENPIASRKGMGKNPRRPVVTGFNRRI